MRNFKLRVMRCSLVGIIILSFLPCDMFSQQILKYKSGVEYKVKIVYLTKDTIKFQMSSKPNVTWTDLTDKIETIRMQKLPSSNQYQVIKMVDGNELQVWITGWAIDTLICYKFSDLSTPITILMENVKSIETISLKEVPGTLSYPMGLVSTKEDSLNYRKMMHNKKVTNTAAWMLTSSVLFGGISAVLAIDAVNNTEDNAGKVVVASTTALLATGFFIGGTIALICGIVNTKKYKSKLKNIDFDIRWESNQKGISVKYRF